MDRSGSFINIMVFLKYPWRLSLSIVSLVVTLMAALREIILFGTMKPSMCTFTSGLLGSTYFRKITLPNIMLDNCPIKFMVGVPFFFLHVFLKHFSLMSLL